MDKPSTQRITMQAKAVAAAKLVLQDLDPESKKRRQLFNSGPPQGVLAIHAKYLKNFSKTFFFTSAFAQRTEIFIELKISAQNLVKYSRVVSVRKDITQGKTSKTRSLWHKNSLIDRSDNSLTRGSNASRNDSLSKGDIEVTLDEVKMFSLELSNHRADPKNEVAIEISEVQESNHRIRNIGKATLHLFDLINEMHGTKSVQLLVNDKQVADLECEFIFRYGALGYGYSHQLQQNFTPIAQIMNESMFFKLDPPLDRMDDNGLLAPTQAHTPNLIKRSEDVDEESLNARNNSVPSSGDLFTAVDTSNIEQLIEKRNRLKTLKEGYLTLKTRNDRMRYLERLLSKSGISSSDINNDFVDGSDNSDGAAGGATTTDSQRQAEEVKTVIGNLSPLLFMANGLQSRKNTRPELPASARDGNSFDADHFERLRKLYEEELVSSGGKAKAEEDPTKSGEKETETAATSKPTQKGFMKILRRKVLLPMRFSKTSTEGRSLTSQLSNAEEGQSSPRTADKTQEKTDETTGASTSDDEEKLTNSFLHVWKRGSAPPQPTIATLQSDGPERSQSLQPKASDKK